MEGSLLPGRLLRQAGAPRRVTGWPGVDNRDPRLAEVLAPDAPLLELYQFTLHGEGTVWDAAHDRLLWSDVPNRRLLAWLKHAFSGDREGRVTVADDGVGLPAPAAMPAPARREGLGRRLTRALPAQLGGRIEVSANEPSGVRHVLTFPRSRPCMHRAL